ncbi:hypothetical protein OIU77_010123 [Salix suchowensis]|uniref:Uncharacterized protein n=1 Tax=Salix suchowensis TaxID=1278906 RepID=A0ABQ9A902_9ROSI|nr:hypothetical protein OIU77_010123 [Salix suchowensis]
MKDIGNSGSRDAPSVKRICGTCGNHDEKRNLDNAFQEVMFLLLFHFMRPHYHGERSYVAKSSTSNDIACQMGPKIGAFSVAGVGRLSMHRTNTPSLVLEPRTLVQRGTNSS